MPRLQLFFECLPDSVRESLMEDDHMPSPKELAFLCEDSADEEELSMQVVGDAGLVPLLKLLKIEAGKLSDRRVRRRICIPRVQQLVMLRTKLMGAEPEAMPMQCTLDTGAAWKRQSWPTRYSKARDQADPQARQLLESTEQNRWIDKLVEVLNCSRMPVCETALRSMDPARTLRAAAGCARPRTIRKRIKQFEQMSQWMEIIHLSKWPATDG